MDQVGLPKQDARRLREADKGTNHSTQFIKIAGQGERKNFDSFCVPNIAGPSGGAYLRRDRPGGSSRLFSSTPSA
jgi:hypothetical protein